MTDRHLTDVRYGPAEAGNLLDLHLPDSTEGAAPIVVWSAGSGWMRDDGKETSGQLVPFFTGRGYAVVGVTVRSSAQATFPAQLHDIDAALGWVAAHASEHGLDAGRIATIGNSSGGWFANMAAVATDHPVGAVIDLYGPTDFLQMDAHMLAGCAEFNARLELEGCHDDPRSPESALVGGPIQERPEECARANPVRHVHPTRTQTLIMHGRADPTVPHHQSELLFAAMTAYGNSATFYTIHDAVHEHTYLDAPLPPGAYVVRETSDGRERSVPDAPPPSWELIGRFIDRALGRAAS